MSVPGRVRRATVDDAPALASINVRAWQVGYRGLLPGRYLERLSISERIPDWEERIASPGDGVSIFVCETPRDGVVSYCIAGRYRFQSAEKGPVLPANTGEIIAVYGDPDHWGTRAGHAVFEAGLEDLRRAGFALAALWMLERNTRAAQFYESHGWQPDGGRLTEPLTDDGQLQAIQVRYVFELD